MRNKQLSLLLHPLFIISLSILLLNDFYFKYQFHNWFTGKLSDFAGLFVFPIFLFAFYPKHKKDILIATGLLFLWWKSPLSSGFIGFANTQLSLPVYRIIDYSDWLALFMLLPASYIKPVNYPPSFIRSFAVYCIGAISFFAFSATSMIKKLADDNKVMLDKNISTKKKEKEIVSILEKNGLSPKPDSAFYEKVWNDRDFYLKRLNQNGTYSMTRIDSLSSGLYRRTGYGSLYTIPEMHIAGDSIYNLQLVIDEYQRHRTGIRLYSFEHKSISADSANGGYNTSGYSIWRKFKKPIRKKFKAMLK